MPRVLRGKPDKNPKLRIREYDDTGNFGGKTSRRINKYVDFGKEAEEDRRLDKLTARRLRREARNRPPRQATPVEPPAPAPAPAAFPFICKYKLYKLEFLRFGNAIKNFFHVHSPFVF